MPHRYLSGIPFARRPYPAGLLALIILLTLTGIAYAYVPLFFPGEQDSIIYNSGVPDYSPAVAYDSTLDRHLFVWVSDTGGGCAFGCRANLYGRITGGEGNPLIGPFAISTANDFQLDPAAAYSPTVGEYLVVWQDNRFGDTGNTDFRANAHFNNGSDPNRRGQRRGHRRQSDPQGPDRHSSHNHHHSGF